MTLGSSGRAPYGLVARPAEHLKIRRLVLKRAVIFPTCPAPYSDEVRRAGLFAHERLGMHRIGVQLKGVHYAMTNVGVTISARALLARPRAHTPSSCSPSGAE